MPASSVDDRGDAIMAGLRRLLSAVLLGGVMASSFLLVVGLVAGLVAGWSTSLAGSASTSVDPTDFSGLVAGLTELRPVAIAQLGLVVLLATPVLRVASSVVAFVLERDRAYVAISAVVLVILLASIFLVR